MAWLAYAQLVRLPNVFTAMADIVLAGAVTGAILDHFGAFTCVLIASSFLYCGGMVWNDWFDLEQDLRERSKRPLPSGRITPAAAAILGTILVLLGLAFAGLADIVAGRAWHSLLIAGCLVGAIFLYDGVVKRTWLGPFAMGSCRFFNILLGLSAFAGLRADGTPEPIPAWGYAMALAVGTYIVGVTWFAKTEARMSKQPTLLAAALVMAGGLLLCLTVPTLALEISPAATPASLFPYALALFGFYVGMKVVPAVRDPQPSRVQPAVKRSVLGLVFLDAILATSLIGWPGLFIAVLIIPAMFLGKWLYST